MILSCTNNAIITSTINKHKKANKYFLFIFTNPAPLQLLYYYAYSVYCITFVCIYTIILEANKIWCLPVAIIN
jgi:hypothetical protein